MRKQVFIINGSGGSGKDTVVSIVDDTYWTKNIDSVAIVKEAATLLGWDGTKSDENRLFLSNLKGLSERHFNHSFRYVCEQLTNFFDYKEEVAFVHIREPQLIEKTKLWCEISGYRCYTILVTNPNVEEITTNSSDKNVENYEYDIHIANDGTLEDLRCNVRKIIGGYLK